ncbi:unnamed protein product [Caenorhabditis sp. 36 PRJEB53466]|nr:unnamed protein product [Caenorhabditis sp. 36 PRJEB53466]
MDDRVKKRYVFLISRALSSTMSIISIVLLPVAILATDYNFWFMAFFIIFDMLSFLSFLGGIVGTTVTIYVVVVHPTYYRRELSYHKCVILVIVFWVCSVIVAVGCGTVQAAFMGKNSPFECDYHTCEKPVLFFAITCISVALVFSLGIQSFVIFSLFRHEKKSKERGDFSSTTRAMTGVKRRLISGFFVFGMMAVFEITSAVMLVQCVFSVTDEFTSLCDILSSSRYRLEVVIFSAILTLLWGIGLFFDPIFTIMFDPIFSRQFSRHDISSAGLVLEWVTLYVSTSIFFLSAILNVYSFITAVYTYIPLDSDARKHYVFVLSRMLSSILTVCALLILECSLFTKEVPFSFTFYAFAFSFYNFSLDSLLISYIFVSFMTYFGVVHPIFYQEKLTLKVLYLTVVATWIVSLSLAIPLGLFQAAANVPGPVSCDLHYCVKVVEWITFSLACFTLLMTVLLTGFVVVSLYWHHYQAKKNGIKVSGAVDRARVRLTWTFVALVLICFIELFPVGMLIGFNQSMQFPAQYAIVSSLETLVGSLVFLTDPIVNIFFDKNISQTVKRHMTWIRTLFSSKTVAL